jgi:hypothetical protein
LQILPSNAHAKLFFPACLHPIVGRREKKPGFQHNDHKNSDS